MTGTGDDRDQRQQEIAAVVVKIVGVAVAIGLVVGVGAWVMVKTLGLSASDSAGSTSGAVQPVTPLPTTALPVPSGSSSPSAGVVTGTPSGPASGALYLAASPLMVQPMERINLTGQWPGHDNESLLVQRFDGGSWTNFGVQVSVNLGTFETYVMTGRTGDQRFRVFDPASNTASNDVTVTIGS